MNISIEPDMQRRIEEQMKRGGFSSPTEVLRYALETLDEIEGEPIEELDPETQAAIEEGLAQADRGEGRPWAEVREELRARFIRK